MEIRPRGMNLDPGSGTSVDSGSGIGVDSGSGIGMSCGIGMSTGVGIMNGADTETKTTTLLVHRAVMRLGIDSNMDMGLNMDLGMDMTLDMDLGMDMDLDMALGMEVSETSSQELSGAVTSFFATGGSQKCRLSFPILEGAQECRPPS